MMYDFARALLFRLDAERAHDLTIGMLSRGQRTPLASLWRQQVSGRSLQVMGLTFPNPVGLAAGLDKNGACIDAFAEMGFGFIEVGTVTPRPQSGNPKPRLFRLPAHEAIINRMGFNNLGVDACVENIKTMRFRGILGVNIGKNKDTPDEQGVDDYLFCMRRVYPYASYITVNISSPNTPGLRAFQHGAALADLLAQLKAEQAKLHQEHGRYVPLAVKIAPDLSTSEVADFAAALLLHDIDAVIATNTTLDRTAVAGAEHAEEAGGLSGKVLFDSSTKIVAALAEHLAGKIPIIAVGGIDSVATARAKLDAGASLVQIYTGFIYHGPKRIKEIVEGL